ncbi:unnamed protein product [Schistosoma margrebowiei]|uniref:Uncharacterized protein n=1 Tax=Schistosoma margrebowiei TaxID=48269 RepID=A0A183MW05_9TREM|nr:unnamed protein product [Schistosoma margrebowiei]
MQLDDLDIADDLPLLSHTQQQMQEKTTSVAAVSAAVAFNIHKAKNTISKNLLWERTNQVPDEEEIKEEALEMDRTNIEERTQLYHKARPQRRRGIPKNTLRQDKYEKNE